MQYLLPPIIAFLTCIPADGYASSLPRPASVASAGTPPVAFRLLPGGGEYDAAIRTILTAEAAASGSAPTTLEAVETWSSRLTDALRREKFAIAQVLVTRDDWINATQGKPLTFSVFPGVIGAITLDNKTRVKEARLQALITRALCGGEQAFAAQHCVLQTGRLERVTQLLQDVPGVGMAAVPALSPGETVGTARLHFRLAPSGKPLQFDVMTDNQGVASTGIYRLGTSVSGNNIMGIGDAWSATGNVTDKGMWVGALNGSAPLGERGVRLTGNAASQAYSVRVGGVALDGKAWTGGVGLDYPFVRGLDRNVRGQLSALHTYTTSGFPDFDVSTHSRLNYLRGTLQVDNGDRAQQLQLSPWSVSAALTLGQQSNNSPQDLGPQRAGNYAKFSISGSLMYPLGQGSDRFLHGRFSGQLASRNLDFSEKLAMGGVGAVRAFSSDEVSVDDGVVLNLGLYQRFQATEGHLLQPGVFMDYGIGRINHHPWADWESGYIGIADVNNVRSVAGYGLSLDWLTPFGVTTSLSYARRAPFSEDSWIKSGSADNRAWFSVAYTF